jgi:hypothetical protein
MGGAVHRYRSANGVCTNAKVHLGRASAILRSPPQPAACQGCGRVCTTHAQQCLPCRVRAAPSARSSHGQLAPRRSRCALRYGKVSQTRAGRRRGRMEAACVPTHRLGTRWHCSGAKSHCVLLGHVELIRAWRRRGATTAGAKEDEDGPTQRGAPIRLEGCFFCGRARSRVLPGGLAVRTPVHLRTPHCLHRLLAAPKRGASRFPRSLRDAHAHCDGAKVRGS